MSVGCNSWDLDLTSSAPRCELGSSLFHVYLIPVGPILLGANTREVNGRHRITNLCLLENIFYSLTEDWAKASHEVDTLQNGVWILCVLHPANFIAYNMMPGSVFIHWPSQCTYGCYVKFLASSNRRRLVSRARKFHLQRIIHS